ncbi:TM0106 family RecB-like putative nuclease [Methylomonas sp. AM2-LC]|uniref:TM0106 family RecB-like putative nuclease n=1 Tax=Methylomonas sp. AM2-LC TaxID=3153301 RepID=UPI0032677BB9
MGPINQAKISYDMYKRTNNIIYSPSDLVVFMRSNFASWMDRLSIEHPEMIAGIERTVDPLMNLLANKGNLHENNFLRHLVDTHGVDSVAIVKADDQSERIRQTIAFMESGFPFIYQAALARDCFSGSADFLVKKQGSSCFGDYQYEPWDCKLSQTTQAYFLIQLCCYSWMLEEIQQKRPMDAVIMLGDFTEDRFSVARYYNFFNNLKTEFLGAQITFIPDFSQMPDPAFFSENGTWTGFANEWMERTDSLGLVAGIRKSQIKKLRDASVNTLTELANLEDTFTIKGFQTASLSKLKAQAEIQFASRGLKKPLFKVLSIDNGKGLSTLPPESAHDLYFDVEGHPLYDRGLEYLWGVTFKCPVTKKGKKYAFKDFWAHTPDQEKAAFEKFVDWAYSRWQRNQTMHIYHYAAYEVSVMRRLSTKYETRIRETAELLANGVFVDLFRIVSNSLIVGEPKYSIKNLEHIYRDKRTTQVANGGDSVVFYEMWRQSGGVDRWCSEGYAEWEKLQENFDWKKWPELNDIREYNIDDCESTLDCCAWLRDIQTKEGISYAPLNKLESDTEKTVRQIQSAEKKKNIKEWHEQLFKRFSSDEYLQSQAHVQLAMDVLGYFNRENKPKIWAFFERQEKTDEALFDDDTCINGLVIKNIQQVVDSTFSVTCEFDPRQPIRKDKFSTGTIKGTDVKFKAAVFLPCSENNMIEFSVESVDALKSVPGGKLHAFADEPFLNTEKMETRLCEVAEAVLDMYESDVVSTILNQDKPTFNVLDNNDQSPILPINHERFITDNEYLSAVIRSIQSLNQSVMCIQGPPGAGKTFFSSHVITALVESGKRVGVMSNSHAAIMNLLDSVLKIRPNLSIAKVGGFGSKQDDFRKKYPEENYPNFIYRSSMMFTKRDPYHSFALVGGTAFTFASDIAFDHPLDVLFVDESSQTALAHILAVAGAAKSIVLMGDQMQLGSPTQGTHPGNSGLSALEHMLAGHSVIPEDKGIFLDKTYRMNPSVCEPLSEVVYEGKLRAAEGNEKQIIAIPNPNKISISNGILVVDAEHIGNRQSSQEEVLVIKLLIDELKTGMYVDKHGASHAITNDNILIISPFNMQVNLLKEHLPGFSIGTIDKFQGQESAVVIISMAVSDVEESSRGLSFLFDINRLNVAISRAKALAIIVANPGLEKCNVTSLEQMEKCSFFSRLIAA